MGGLVSDLALAFVLADVADTVTIKLCSPHGVASKTKADGTPVTTADGEAEDAILRAVGAVHPDDGFLGEEIGSRQSRNERRWIVDGIDGTSGYVAGLTTWGTLIALEQRGEIILGVVSSPAQDKRWWARRDCGAFAGTCESNANGHSIRVSSNERAPNDRVLTLSVFNYLAHKDEIAVEEAGERFSDHSGRSRLDSRTATYSNGACHNKILDSLKKF